jgi:hypothetical protein
MSKIFRITVASAVIGGVAALTPLSAQAKAEPEITGSVTLESCASATAASATGVISGLNFTVRVPAIEPGAVYETRARIFTVDARGRQNFSTKRVRVNNVSDVGSGSVAPGQHIWRLDVTNTTAEAAGLPALAFTSAGFVNCD